MKTIIITGGAGFIGSNLCEYLLKKENNGLYPKYNVIAIDDLSTGSEDNIKNIINNKNFTFINKKIQDLSKSDKKLITEKTKNSLSNNFIIHLAASLGVRNIVENPIKSMINNTDSTKAALRLTDDIRNHLNQLQIRNFIFTSTSEVYGTFRKKCVEGQDLSVPNTDKLRGSYGAAKILDEFLVTAFCRNKRSEIENYSILRLFNIVGPKQAHEYGMVLPKFVKLAMENKPLVVYNNGKQKRTFTSIYDLLTIFRALINGPVFPKLFELLNISSGNTISIKKLAKMVIKNVKSRGYECDSFISFEPTSHWYGKDFYEPEIRIPSLEKLLKLTEVNRFRKLDNIIDTCIDDYSESENYRKAISGICNRK